jgi:vacuolar-type H+-ATPase catalytic subunit A/Vma1
MYCSPAKQLWMLRLLVSFSRRAQNIIKAGGSLADLRDIPALDRLNRMKSEIGNEDMKAMNELEQTMSSQLDALERKFKS